MRQKLLFWIKIFFVLNFITLLSNIILNGLLSDSGSQYWLGFALGFLIQFPVCLLASVIHHHLQRIAEPIFTTSISQAYQYLLCFLLLLIITVPYCASQILHFQIGVYTSLDAMLLFLSDTKQILPLILDGYLPQLLFVIAMTAFISFRHVRSHQLDVEHQDALLHDSTSPSITTAPILIVALCFFLIGLTPFYYQGSTSKETLSYSINQSFPSTFLIADLFPDTVNRGNFTKDITLPIDSLARQVSIEEYASNNEPKSTPNVFIIMLESISSDHTGFNGYTRKDITPNLDALSLESLIFSNVYAPSNHSNYAQTSFHSSQYPLRRKWLDRFTVINYPKIMLFDILSHYGYETAFYSAQNENWQGMKKFIEHDSDGIDHFKHAEDYPNAFKLPDTKVDDAFILEKAKAFIAERETPSPLFLYLNFQRSHFPYDLIEGSETPYSDHKMDFNAMFFYYDKKHIPALLDRYDNSVRYVDTQVGEFISFLKQKGLYDDSIIIVTADHGEAFYEKGYPTHGLSMYEDQIQTFALIKTPKAMNKGRRSDAVSLIDINPTILDIMGLKNHPNFQGAPIMQPHEKGRLLFSTAQGMIHANAVINYPWKLFESTTDGIKLINLELNPKEDIDYSSEHPEQRAQMEAALRRYIEHQLDYYERVPQEVRSTRYPPNH